jgi:membrane AbrB-like protein
MPAVLAHIAQILVAALGGLLFDRLGVPAAWMSGAVIATVLWGFTGWGVRMPPALRDTAMLISGTTMGAAVTPAAIASIERYPLSLVALLVGIAAISAASAFWLTRMSGWRRDDAVLASVPGALSTVLAVAADRNAAVASIAIVQSLRLFVLVMLLPSAVVLLGGGGSGAGAVRGQALAEPGAMALVLAGGLAVGILFERLRVAAPVLLGATLVSTGLHVTDLATGTIPPTIATAGLVLIGIFVAERFRSLNGAFLRKTIPAALGSFAISLAVAASFSGIAAWAAEVSYADALIAFAPGGLEAMMVLALILGLDPLYVGVHHLARFIGIGLVVPFLVVWLQRNDPPDA